MADRLAASTNCYHPYSLDEALAGIAAAGFTSVELSSVPGWTEHVARNAEVTELDEVKDALARYNLTPISLSGHSDLITDEGVAAFRQALDLARALGIGYVTTGAGGDGDLGGTLDQRRSRFLERIDGLVEEAMADNITICLETHGGLLATGAMAASLLETIGKSNIGINYDAANVIYYAGVRPETDIAAAAPWIRHLHLKDKIGGAGVWNFPALGTGEIDYPAIFRALDAVGFNGPCSVEIEFQREPWPPLPEVNDAVATSYRYARQFVK